MKSAVLSIAVAALFAGSTQAFTINWYNKCGYTIWPGLGRAPNGQVDSTLSFGARLDPQGRASFGVNDRDLGIRSWARTGCDGNGANCATGRSNGGLYPTDAGITSRALYAEFGYGNNGPQFGGERTFWDLSHVDADINVDTALSSSDGGVSVTCRRNNCPIDQAYANPDDHVAVRSSALGATYTITYCP